MRATSLRTIGQAARFFLTRHWVRTSIGPYVVTTTEVRRSAYETVVCWGEAGPEVEAFGSALCFDERNAAAAHGEMCERVERASGAKRLPASGWDPPAA